jgi:hypothetical protein
VGEPLLGVNLVGVLAGYFEQLVVVPGLQMVTLFLRTPGTPRPPV